MPRPPPRRSRPRPTPSAGSPTRASAFTDHPALLRLRELDALAHLAVTDGARIFVGFDKHVAPDERG